jgi:hypothetical protein
MPPQDFLATVGWSYRCDGSLYRPSLPLDQCAIASDFIDGRSTFLAECDLSKNRFPALRIMHLWRILIGEDDTAMVRRPIAPWAASGKSDGAMGRSQVVRQRILIPPFPGSNPGAPASQCGLCGPFPRFRKTPELPALSGVTSVSATEELRSFAADRRVWAPSLQARIFHIQNFLPETWFDRAETSKPHTRN